MGNLKSSKKGKLKKGQEDDVTEGQIGGLHSTDFGNTKGRRGKNKNKQDDVTESGMPDETPGKRGKTPTTMEFLTLPPPEERRPERVLLTLMPILDLTTLLRENDSLHLSDKKMQLYQSKPIVGF